MVFDDYVYLQTNPLVRDTRSFGYLSQLREFAMRPTRMGLPPDLATNFMLRPVAYATFHLNYLFDEYRPRWFRVVNIGIHAVNGLLLFALVRSLLAKAPSLPRRSAGFIALTAALLFVAHPMATESVTYIVQRFTSLGTLFYLATLYLHFALRGMEARRSRSVLRLASVVTLVLGMLTKECTVTAPVVAVMLDWLVMRSSLPKALRSALPLLICLPIIPSLVILTAWAHNGDAVTLGDAINVANFNGRPLSHWHYLLTQFTVVTAYLGRLAWPAGLNLDPEWPLHASLFTWPVVRSLAVIGAMLGGAAWVFRRFRQDVRAACVLAFVLWYFATIIVSSGLVPLPDMMAEHRSYLPSIGIFIATACLLDWLRCWAGIRRCGRWLAPLAVVTAVGALGAVTVHRNEVWRSAVSLWEDTAAKSPGNARAWANLGAAYTRSLRYAEAVPCYEKAIVIEPKYQTAYFNLASVLNALHRSQAALDIINRLLGMNLGADQSPDLQCQRGIALIESGKVDEGLRLLNAIVEQKPDHRMSHVVLGMVYSQTNHPR